MPYITIDDKDEVQKILLEQIEYYKGEAEKGYEGIKYYELIHKIIEIVKSVDDEETEENEDYDEYCAISDIKWWLRSRKLIEDEE